MTEEETHKDRFEISFRVLGNEIFGMELTSESKLKNWAFFGIITLAAMTILFSELSPAVIEVINQIQ